MKGLFLKDLYMMKVYCRQFLLIAVVFLAVSFAGMESAVFRAYPTILVGMIPITLISYEEREKWDRFTCMLPLSKAQLVAEKYLLGAALICLMFLVTTLAGFVARRDGETAQNLLNTGCILLAAALFMPALTLPFIYALGAEKGRIMFYVVIALICGMFVLVSRSMISENAAKIAAFPGLAVLLGVIALYVISCFIAIGIYRRREI